MALRLMNRLPKKGSLSSITIFFHNATRFTESVNEDQERLPTTNPTYFFFLHSVGYLNCTTNHIRLDLLLILAHA